MTCNITSFSMRTWVRGRACVGACVRACLLGYMPRSRIAPCRRRSGHACRGWVGGRRTHLIPPPTGTTGHMGNTPAPARRRARAAPLARHGRPLGIHTLACRGLPNRLPYHVCTSPRFPSCTALTNVLHPNPRQPHPAHLAPHGCCPLSICAGPEQQEAARERAPPSKPALSLAPPAPSMRRPEAPLVLAPLRRG